jgi:hypothetical protein
MYYGQCSNVSEIVDILPFSDIIATQENKPDIFPYPSITHGTGTEQVAMYSSSMSAAIQLSSEKKRTELGLETSVPIRYAIITSTQGITIGNIHMEGGRFTDLKLLKSHDSNLLFYKLSLLEDLIEHQPDILVGDFNSPYSEDPVIQQAYDQSQYDYFKSLIKPFELTSHQTELIHEWIHAPFRLLKKRGYTYATPRNYTDISNHLGHSIVDFIWYKSDKMKCIDSYILPLPFDKTFCISDHNPVIASFQLRSVVYPDLPTTFIDNVTDSDECNKVHHTITPDIKTRLDGSPLVQAFHVTTEENAIRIWNSGTLLCGASGTFGPGIYCCPRPLDCIYKAAYKNIGIKYIYLIEVDLRMGHSFESSVESRGINLDQYDSVIYKRFSGLEYVVYRPHQVHIRRMYRIYLRNITELVKSYTQTRYESFRAINNYVLGGWYYTAKPISRLHDLGPYQITSIVDRIPECPYQYFKQQCSNRGIEHNLLFSHNWVFQTHEDITSFTGRRLRFKSVRKLKKSRQKWSVKR